MTSTEASVKIDVLVINPGEWRAQRKTVERGLASMQSLVGGYIEALSLTDEVSAYINEEGKYNGAHRNEAGTALVKHALASVGRQLIPGDFIAGSLVLMGQPDDEGEDTSVPESIVDLLNAVGIKIGAPGEPAIEVHVPEVIESKVTGRERRSMESQLDTSMAEDVKLEVYTSHDKDRKEYRTTTWGVRVGGGWKRMSLMDGLQVAREATPRFSAKGLAEAHEKALLIVRQALVVNPDTFTGILLKTPEGDR